MAPFPRPVGRASTILPGGRQTTIIWFFDGTMDRAENYETLDLALARAEHVRSILIQDGWVAHGSE